MRYSRNLVQLLWLMLRLKALSTETKDIFDPTIANIANFARRIS